MSSSKKDPYNVLGVPKNATDDEIKKAYRRLARKNHPDANPGDKDAETRFKEIAEAYSILSDPDQRAVYDRLGWAGLGATAGGTGGDPFAGFGFGDIFSSIFGDFFGGRTSTRSRRPTTGRSIRIVLPITFEEAASGFEKKVDVKKNEVCDLCNGSRAAQGTSPKRCSVCNGSGVERIQQRTPFGYMINETMCRTCQGLGEIIDHPCPDCRGRGMVEKSKKITVKVPAGIDDGQRLRVGGEGEPGPRGAPPGDLYVDIQLKKHKYFHRERNELIYEQKINFAQAALGDTILVPTLVKGEKAKVKIPSGTQSDTIFRLRGKGFPNLQGFGKGDMHVIVRVETPKKLSAKEKELFNELQELWDNKSSKK
ncbi:MAG: molecular chaperone DnaJ [Asgard group archaeon]|nr:molecular chaperone DnaJ [Asgard group archaeon]